MFSQHACQQALNKYNLNHSVGHVWRYLYTEVEISLTLCLKLTYVYTMFEDIFSACLNTCVHHCWWYVYIMLKICICTHHALIYVWIIIFEKMLHYVQRNVYAMLKDKITPCCKTLFHKFEDKGSMKLPYFCSTQKFNLRYANIFSLVGTY